MAKKIFILFFLFTFFSFAQKDTTSLKPLPEKVIMVPTTVYEGDTIPYIKLETITCYANRVFKNRKQQVAWDRIKYNTKKVYPYAILAAAKLKEYDHILAEMNEDDRKKYTKLVEEQLKKQFGEELKNLSINQGRILIKLIDRETGRTTYDVIKTMRGSFSAFMWQSVALMFSSNLKVDYDGEGNDRAIEEAIKLVENGDF